MSDEEVEVPVEVEVEEDCTDLMTACKRVLRNALKVDGCIRGLHEVAKTLDASKAQVVMLAESCNEPAYKKLIQGLCAEKSVPLIDIPDNKQLGAKTFARLCSCVFC